MKDKISQEDYDILYEKYAKARDQLFGTKKPNGIRVWSFDPPNITEDAEFEIIQPKQLKQ